MVSELFFRKFRFVNLKYTIKALDRIILPEHPGSTLRGGFGTAFKNVACTRRETNCQDCLLINSCPFGYIFQTPPPDDTERLSTLSDIPRPYIIRTDPDVGGEYSPGEEMEFETVIVGRAIDYLPYFILAFKELGEMGLGRGRGRYELDEVNALNQEGDEVEIYIRESGKIRNIDTGILWDEIEPEKIGKVEVVKVHFISPLRLKVDGVILEWAPPFDELVMSLARRINNLAYFHCGIDEELDFTEIYERSLDVMVMEEEISVEGWSRYSGKQDSRIPMKGVVGWVEYGGDVGQFLPMLRLGEYLHLGKNTTMGFGRIGVEVYKFED
jgi:CRISPR-associated endoribonuclease Cas6